MSFVFRRLDIPDVILVEAMAAVDQRGAFAELYKRSEFAAGGIPTVFVQDNCSSSVHGVLRGLHYQRFPKAQAKLVTVVRGEIFDVAVDLRKDSPTFGHWTGVVLSAAAHRTLYVPEGFAHGFCVVSDEANVLYKVTAEYAPGLEGGVRWNDPTLNIAWPVADPILSARDRVLPLLAESVGDPVGMRPS